MYISLDFNSQMVDLLICCIHKKYLFINIIHKTCNFPNNFSSDYRITGLLKHPASFSTNNEYIPYFDSSSPNGILLFREVSKLIVAYGTRVLSLPTPADIYTYKYKGIWISLTILTRGEFRTIGSSFLSIYHFIDLSFDSVDMKEEI